MPMKIAILEDNADRTAAMKSCLADRFPHYEAYFFSAPKEMRVFLEVHLEDVILISLDHDLELMMDRFGKASDPGSGTDVVNYLVQKPATCPVVVHTTNSTAAVGMEMTLQEAGWKTYRVVPYDDLRWISEEWFRTVRRALVATAVASPGKRD